MTQPHEKSPLIPATGDDLWHTVRDAGFHVPAPLATSEDLRAAANIVRISGDPDTWHCVRELTDRLDATADTLDHLHALPGLREAMERLGQLSAKASSEDGGVFSISTDGMRKLGTDLIIICNAINLLLPPGEPQEAR